MKCQYWSIGPLSVLVNCILLDSVLALNLQVKKYIFNFIYPAGSVKYDKLLCIICWMLRIIDLLFEYWFLAFVALMLNFMHELIVEIIM